jgi:hypothetical protein
LVIIYNRRLNNHRDRESRISSRTGIAVELA